MEMEIDGTNGIRKKSCLNFFPVNINDRGEGLPYAPADWPEPGDQWSWKVGKRITASGYLQDRYIYPPERFCDDGSRKKHVMASKQAVKEYIRSRFPNADVDAFFASFSWKIPSNQIAVLELRGVTEMEIDGTNVIQKKSSLNFFPVNINDKGVGLPYAPVDWPEPGDQWTWKVGKRITDSGYLQDRYLYPPERFCDDGSRKKHGMASKQAVKEYIRSRFPNADVDAFFASFSWKIPSNQIAVLELRGVTEMEIDGTNVIQKKSGLNFFPVNINDKGVGLPYAPVDWPEPGDQWTWKVGKRITGSGYLQDRYLYPPERFCDDGSRKKHGMASKQAVKEYIRSRFPNADVDAFFGSFSWKIPSNQIAVSELRGEGEDGNHDREAESSVDKPCCKAGNRSCSSLVKNERNSSQRIPCDVCCGEPRFCRDCSCILCGKSVRFLKEGGYGLIRCEALVDGLICGHVAHIKCGLRAYFVGTVGGSIGLDAEYYCRRCGSKTDLVSHAEKLLHICVLQTSRETLDMVLTVGVCLLRGSQRSDAKFLLHRFSSALLMLRNGGSLEDIGKRENRTEVIPAGPSAERAVAIKLGGEIDQILKILKKSLEQEYGHSQKKLIQSLHQQLQHERHSLFKHMATSTWTQAVLTAIIGRVKQMRKKVMKFLLKGF